MQTKEDRITITTKTMQIIAQGYFESPSGQRIHVQESLKAAAQGTVMYDPIKSSDLLQAHTPASSAFETRYEVTSETTLDAVRRLLAEGENRVACLRSASILHQAFGHDSGRNSQENRLARATGLQACLKGSDWVYHPIPRNWRERYLNSDHIAYCPEVPNFKDEDGQNLAALACVSIISATPVDAEGMYFRVPHGQAETARIMQQRIAKVLAIALAHGHETLVLCGWGCGEFRNPPGNVAQYFKSAIDAHFPHDFKRIVFALGSRKRGTLSPFWMRFTRRDGHGTPDRLGRYWRRD